MNICDKYMADIKSLLDKIHGCVLQEYPNGDYRKSPLRQIDAPDPDLLCHLKAKMWFRNLEELLYVPSPEHIDLFFDILSDMADLCKVVKFTDEIELLRELGRMYWIDAKGQKRTPTPYEFLLNDIKSYCAKLEDIANQLIALPNQTTLKKADIVIVKKSLRTVKGLFVEPNLVNLEASLSFLGIIAHLCNVAQDFREDEDLIDIRIRELQNP